ncbi:MAG: flagellar type III secretion system pore protein FliP [Planctomycetota bacterium]|nr:flagellar type III secretion system pore protein FliP [Planctomycetota bacterium]
MWARLALLLAFALAPAAFGQRTIGPMPDEPLVPVVSPPATLPAPLPATELGDPTNPLAILAGAAEALPGARASGSNSPSGEGRSGLSTAVNILVVLTVVTLAPSIVLMCTCFLRILVVLGLLKQAMGAASVPPPQVLTALALFMTLLVMSPTIDRVNTEAIAPYRAGEIGSYDELWEKARQPVRDFMFDQIDASGNWSSLYMVMESRGLDVSKPETLTRADVETTVLVPAYVLSELKVAFLMGFKVYLPFLVIDMVISTMLISMSMMMLPPVLISLPFKLLLFVLVDGWTLVTGGLMRSFVTSQPGTHALLDPAFAVWVT